VRGCPLPQVAGIPSALGPSTAHKSLSLKQKTPTERLQIAPPLPFETVGSTLRRIATPALASGRTQSVSSTIHQVTVGRGSSAISHQQQRAARGFTPLIAKHCLCGKSDS
jgi:hypothetical protein